MVTVHRLSRQDVPFTADMSEAVNAEIASLAAWLGLDRLDRAAG